MHKVRNNAPSSKGKSQKGNDYNRGLGMEYLSNTSSPVPRGPSFSRTLSGVGFPQRLSVNHVYSGTYALASTGGSVALQAFRANSLYDPDYTGTGSSSKYYATMATIYNTYLVTKTWYEVEFVGSASAIMDCGVFFLDTYVTPTSVVDVGNYEFGQVGLCTLSVGTGFKKFSGAIDIARVHGMTDIQQDPNNYTSYGSNPNDVVWLTVCSQPVDAASTASMYVRVRIVQEATWRDLKQL